MGKLVRLHLRPAARVLLSQLPDFFSAWGLPESRAGSQSPGRTGAARSVIRFAASCGGCVFGAHRQSLASMPVLGPRPTLLTLLYLWLDVWEASNRKALCVPTIPPRASCRTSWSLLVFNKGGGF